MEWYKGNGALTVVGLLLSCCVLWVACSKDDPKPDFTITGFDPGKGAANLYVTINGEGFDTLSSIAVSFNGADASVISATRTAIVTVVPAHATTGRIAVAINNNKVTSASDFVILPGKWVQKGILPSNKERVLGLGFSVGNKGYLATGDRRAFYVPLADRMNDMMEYDPSTGTWKEKKPLGFKLAGGLGMVIDNKIYVGIGQTDQGEMTNQFWEYDPAADQWTRKADFPGEPRFEGIAFGAGGKGYAGTGYDLTSSFSDWWQYDPITDKWERRSDFAGADEWSFAHFLTGFVLNEKIYMGVGFKSDKQGWWEYNPTNDQWTQKSDFPGKMAWGASGLVLGNRGYIMGAGTECWEYIPLSDSWVQKAFLGQRYMGVAFGIGNKGYYVTGITGVGGSESELAADVWEFSPQ